MPSARRYDAGVTDEFVVPAVDRARARFDDGDALDLLQLPTGPRARDHPRLHRPHVRGIRPPGRPDVALRLPHRVRPHHPGARRLPQGPPQARPRRRPRRAGPAPAPHRRDREVRARDVLLQRRRRDPEGGRDARARAEPQGRHVRPQARDERARGHRRSSSRRSRRIRPTSTSSTSRTATWSATPAYFAAAVRAVEAVDAGVGAVVSAIRARGGVALITADHGNAEAMVDPDGDDAVHGAHARPTCRSSCVADGVTGAASGRQARRRRAHAARPHRRARYRRSGRAQACCYTDTPCLGRCPRHSETDTSTEEFPVTVVSRPRPHRLGDFVRSA